MSVSTEDQIEARAERQMDRLDREYLSSGMDKAEYQRRVDAISLECNLQRQSLANAAAGRFRPVVPQVDAIVARHFESMGSDLCDWGRSLIEARWRNCWPGFAADRLRQAAEYRQSIARDLAWARRGRDGLRACLVAQGLPVNW